MGLDFTHGSNFPKDVLRKFNRKVHPSADSGHFTMVVSFGRANFKLEEDLVSIALEAAIGAFCGETKVSLIKDRVFSFCVSSKAVGFHILKLRKFSCPQFKCYFHLWGRGGPHWEREFVMWQKESDKEWTIVSPNKKRLQLGLSALQKGKPASIIHSANPSRKGLTFADSISYVACLGYRDHNGEVSRKDSIGPLNIGTSSAISVEPRLGSRERVSDPDKEFEALIDDMAFQVWKCSKCLSMGHVTKACTNLIRCRACYNYGHIRKNCLNNNRKGKQCWIPKKVISGQFNLDTTESSPAVSPSPEPFSPRQSTPSDTPPVPPASPSICNLQPPPPMAAYEINPTPWVPNGQQVLDGGPTRLPQTFYTPSETPPRCHDLFCIAYVEPQQQATNHQLRGQVRDFLENQLRIGVEDF
jgi:hypothetical protein